MADDPSTKQDQPSEGAAAPEEKVAQEAAEAKAEVAQAEAEEKPKPKRTRKPAAKKAAAEAPAEEAAPSSRRRTRKPRRSRSRSARARRRGQGRGQAQGGREARRRAGRAPTGERVAVRAQAKYVRTSARKARLVCDHIRGKSVDEARAILAHTPRAVAEGWTKLLESAVANAEHNHELVGEDLRILSVHADEGPTLKRFRPRALGRATKIRKRTSHLTITLTPKE